MELIRVKTLVRCDMPMCNKKASYGITARGGLKSRQINVCPDCLEALYRAIGGEIVPKSPDNMVAQAVKRREENAR